MGESLDAVVAGFGSSSRPGAPRAAGPEGRPASATTFGTVFSRWEELVGPAVARHTRPLRLEGGTLVVAVDHPAWATQMRLLATGVLTRLTDRTGERLDRLEVVVRRET